MLDLVVDLVKGLGGLAFLWILTGVLLVAVWFILSRVFELK